MIWQSKNWNNIGVQEWSEEDRNAYMTRIESEMAQVSSGDVLIMCNIARIASTNVFEGLTDLTFMRCNLINCNLPENTVTEMCNTAENEYVITEDEIIVNEN